MECSICQRSVMKEHLIDGDFRQDCYEYEYCKKCGAKVVLRIEHSLVCKGKEE